LSEGNPDNISRSHLDYSYIYDWRQIYPISVAVGSCEKEKDIFHSMVQRFPRFAAY
jgi:hypothetical protein